MGNGTTPGPKVSGAALLSGRLDFHGYTLSSPAS